MSVERSIDIIIPAHNEQHRIEDTLTRYRQACAGPGVRLVVALDDCGDRTEDVVARHAAQDPRVHAVRYPRLGKGGVVSEAFRVSHADYLAFVDADGATPPQELLRLLDACEHTGCDLAIASRYHPAAVLPVGRGRLRRVAGAGFAALVRRLFGLAFHDTQCGAKVIRRAAAQRIVPLLSARDFVFDVDLLSTAAQLGFGVAEVPTVWLDKDGSRLSTGRDTLRMAASLLVLWARQRVMPVRLPSAAIVELPGVDLPGVDLPGVDPARVEANPEAHHAA